MKTLPFLFVIAIALLTSCSDKPEVETYRLAYPSEASRPAQPAADDPHAGHDHAQAPPLGEDAMNSDLPPDHPPIGGGGTTAGLPAMPTPGMPAMPAPGSAADGPPNHGAAEFSWTTPAGWGEKAGSSMRLVSFIVPGAGEKPGDCSVIKLAGGAGGLVPNINRWRGQVGLPNQSDAEVMKATEKIPTGLKVDAIVVDLRNGEQGILAAIIEIDGSNLFIKMFADTATLDAQGKAFRELVKSFAYANGEGAR